MRDDLTYIAVVLDKSSSMNVVRESTIEGFNKFFAEQRTVPGDALVTVCQFGDRPDFTSILPNQPISAIPDLTVETYVPYGNTALFDAIGDTIELVGAKLSSMNDQDRPSKVVVLIMTDGEENRSSRYSRAKIADKIKHQQEKYSWEFVFIGANQDAVLTAGSLGISQQNALNYTSDSAGTAKAIGITSNSLRSYRGNMRTRGQFYGGV